MPKRGVVEILDAEPPDDIRDGRRAGRRNVSHPSTFIIEKEADNGVHRRKQLEDWVERWLQANQDAEEAGDWTPLADFYTEDAASGWNISPKGDPVCGVAETQIESVALGLEMQGLENWNYEYQKVLVDEKLGEIVGFWKQIVNKSDGTQDEIYGIGGSWFD